MEKNRKDIKPYNYQLPPRYLMCPRRSGKDLRALDSEELQSGLYDLKPIKSGFRLINTELKKTVLVFILMMMFSLIPIISHIYFFKPTSFEQLDFSEGYIEVHSSFHGRGGSSLEIKLHKGNGSVDVHCGVGCEGLNLESLSGQYGYIWHDKENMIYQLKVNDRFVRSYEEFRKIYTNHKVFGFDFIFFLSIPLIVFVYINLFDDPLFFLDDPLKKYTENND